MHNKPKRNKQMRKAKAKKLHAGKTPGWAGATPLLGAFSRPKYRGIAPARPEQLGAMFCPRAGIGACGL
jgi:hypothetical protein